MLDPNLKPEHLYNIAADRKHLNDEILQDIRSHANAYLDLRDWAAQWYGMAQSATDPPKPPLEPDPPKRLSWANKMKPTPRNGDSPADTSAHEPKKSVPAVRRRPIILIPIILIGLGASITWATNALTPNPESNSINQSQSTQTPKGRVPAAETQEPPGNPIRASNASYTCATTGTGVHCWGYLNDTTNQKHSSIEQLADTPITALAVGKTFVTAIDTQGTVFWWTPAQTPDVQTIGEIPTPITDITAGNDHTCAIAQGNAWCWGSNQVGQIRGVPTDTRMEPTQIDGPTNITTINTSGYDTWATDTNGTWVWGNNKYGQANPSDPAETIPPTHIPWEDQQP